jgi:hypothetical protein
MAFVSLYRLISPLLAYYGAIMGLSWAYMGLYQPLLAFIGLYRPLSASIGLYWSLLVFIAFISLYKPLLALIGLSTPRHQLPILNR